MVAHSPAPSIVVVSDDPRVGPALVSYLSASTEATAIEGPTLWGSLSDGVQAAVAVCDLDGTELSVALARIEAWSKDLSLKVIAVSSSPTTRRQARAHGAFHAADKSTDIDHLIESVRSALHAAGR
jgi:DNA-binding NtrC family response regulator